MLNERLAAARMVREALAAAEADLEQTLVNANTLSITLLRARGVAKLPISTGSAALSQVAIAIGHLYAARASMIEAHSELASVRRPAAADQGTRSRSGLPAHGRHSAARLTSCCMIDVTGPCATVRSCQSQ